MKRKLVVALIATATLTLGTVGTVLAVDTAQNTATESVIQGENGYWEIIEHPEEFHYETVHHDAEGYYDKVLVSEEQGHWEQGQQCYTCGGLWIGSGNDAVVEHVLWHADRGETCSSGSAERYVVDMPAVYEDQWVETKPAWDEQVKIVDKESWTEKVWVSTEKPSTGGDTDTETPPTDGGTDTEVPPTDGGTDTEVPPTDGGTDTEVPPTDSGTDTPSTGSNTEQETPDNSNSTEGNSDGSSVSTETVVEETPINQTANNVDENKAPKTGDVASMMALATLVGSAVTGGTVLGIKRRNRK